MVNKPSNKKSICISYLYTTAIISLLPLSGCSSAYDPEGKIGIGLILLSLSGVAYLIGGIVISIFSKKESSGSSDMPPVPTIIVGVVTMSVLYALYKFIF